MTSPARGPADLPSEGRLRRWADDLASDDDEKARRAFTCLDHACRQVLLTAARSFLGDPAKGHDVVQEVLLSVWTSRQELQIEQSVRSYLLAAIRHRCLNAMRWHQRMEEWPAEPRELDLLINTGSPVWLTGVEKALQTLELRERFEQALERLSPARRHVLRLKERGLSNAEIAEFIGISRNAVRLRICQGRKDLRLFLGWLMKEAEGG